MARFAPDFGKWNTVFKRFREWVKRDVFYSLFNALSDDPDMGYIMIDVTIIKVHRHGLTLLLAHVFYPKTGIHFSVIRSRWDL